MAFVTGQQGAFSLKAYRGDATTLLAFDLTTPAARQRLAGFTIQVTPPGLPSYYLQNNLRFEKPEKHAQNPAEPAFSSINAPIHKFRWVHFLAQVHQGLTPTFGSYVYTVTPRYFDDSKSLLPLDPALSASVTTTVDRFSKGSLAVGFTRGFTQSQAFVRHFGLKAKIKPKDAGLLFDTSQIAGTNAEGVKYTYDEMYRWLGFTARERIFELLDEVAADPSLKLDVFAYDLNEPNFVKTLLKLAPRTRVILDDADLHHNAAGAKPEDEFEKMFAAKAGPGRIVRGNFSRYAHDKVLLVSDATGPKKVLTGSTNFSVTGLYVNSNHVLVYDDRAVAKAYADVFNDAWTSVNQGVAFAKTPLANKAFSFKTAKVPDTSITFSPHKKAKAGEILQGLIDRVNAEVQPAGRLGNVLFAVMMLEGGLENPVYEALNTLHRNDKLFSYGISDSPDGIFLYPAGKTTGVLVTGKPVGTQLPKPFNQVPGVGLGHQVHHKFVVCGFNGPDAVVYCGSSNLALKGEQVNGDNLLAVRDVDVAMVFAIQALALVDHFDFLDRAAKGPTAPKPGVAATPPVNKQHAAASAGWFLSTTDTWAKKYFSPGDLHQVDRTLFA